MIVNGEQINLGALSSPGLLDLMEHLELDPRAVAVERNGAIEPRAGWEQVRLLETDHIELVRFVGGG
ncbi:MAG: sulfur carrier protein ThiS [Spirochaetales bacterium]|nr:sulfur carrier protein ThiS [Leptospiraceae bacterium]MCP5480864.1 sulfur carrier protein ThiS [Spirochaetales bacterium]